MSALPMFQISVLISVVSLCFGYVFYKKERRHSLIRIDIYKKALLEVGELLQEKRQVFIKLKGELCYTNIEYIRLKRSLAARKGADTKRAKRVLKYLGEEDSGTVAIPVYTAFIHTSSSSKQSARRKMESLLDLRGKIDWDNVDA